MKKLLFFILLFMSNLIFGMAPEFSDYNQEPVNANNSNQQSSNLEMQELDELDNMQEMLNQSDDIQVQEGLQGQEINQTDELQKQEKIIFLLSTLGNFSNDALQQMYGHFINSFINDFAKKDIEMTFEEPIASIGLERSPLIVALFIGCTSLINDLFEVAKSSSKLDMPIGRLQLTPLFIAVLANGTELVKKFIDSGLVNVNAKNTESESVLMAAVLSKPEIISILIEAGADKNYRSHEGKSFLDMLIARNPKVVPYILKYYTHKELNCPNFEGCTALMVASGCGQKELIPILINAGVDINAKDNSGHTALFFAISKYPQIVKLLINYGAQFNYKDRENHTPLMYACATSAKTTAILINAGADTTVIDDEGRTCLMLAICECPEAIEPLLKFGINVNFLNPKKHTALIYAWIYGGQLMPRLLQAGADPKVCVFPNDEIKRKFLNACYAAGYKKERLNDVFQALLAESDKEEEKKNDEDNKKKRRRKIIKK